MIANGVVPVIVGLVKGSVARRLPPLLLVTSMVHTPWRRPWLQIRVEGHEVNKQETVSFTVTNSSSSSSSSNR